MTKDDLSRLRTPILYILGGAEDVAHPHALDDFRRIERVPVFIADRKNAGHIGVFNDPSGRGTEIEIDWLRWQLDATHARAELSLETIVDSVTHLAGPSTGNGFAETQVVWGD